MKMVYFLFTLLFLGAIPSQAANRRPLGIEKLQQRLAQIFAQEAGMPIDRVEVRFDPYKPSETYLGIITTEKQKDLVQSANYTTLKYKNLGLGKKSDLKMILFISEQLFQDVKHDAELKGILMHEFFHEVSSKKLQNLVEQNQDRLANRLGIENKTAFARTVRNGIEFAGTKGIEEYSDFMAQEHLLREGEYPDSLIDFFKRTAEEPVSDLKDYLSRDHLPVGERISALQAHRTYLQRDRDVFPADRVNAPKKYTLLNELRDYLNNKSYLNAVLQDFNVKVGESARNARSWIIDNKNGIGLGNNNKISEQLAYTHLHSYLPFNEKIQKEATQRLKAESANIQKFSREQFQEGLEDAKQILIKEHPTILLNLANGLKRDGFFKIKDNRTEIWNYISKEDYKKLAQQSLVTIDTIAEKNFQELLDSKNASEIGIAFSALNYNLNSRVKVILLSLKKTDPKLFLQLLGRMERSGHNEIYNGTTVFKTEDMKAMALEVLQKNPQLSISCFAELKTMWDGISDPRGSSHIDKNSSEYIKSAEDLKSTIAQLWKKPFSTAEIKLEDLFHSSFLFELPLPDWLEEYAAKELQSPSEGFKNDALLLNAYSKFPNLRKSLIPHLHHAITRLGSNKIETNPDLAQFEQDLLSLYAQDPKWLNDFPSIKNRIDLLIKNCKPFEDYFSKFEDNDFNKRVASAIHDFDHLYSEANKSEVSASKSRRFVYSSFFSIVKTDLDGLLSRLKLETNSRASKKIDPYDDDDKEKKFNDLELANEVFSFMLLNADQFPKFQEKLVSNKKNILLKLFGHYQGFGTSIAAARYFRSAWKNKNELKAALLENIVSDPQISSVGPLSQFMNIEITVDDLFESEPMKLLNSVEIASLYQVIGFSLEIDKKKFQDRLYNLAGNDLLNGKISISQFIEILKENKNTKKEEEVLEKYTSQVENHFGPSGLLKSIHEIIHGKSLNKDIAISFIDKALEALKKIPKNERLDEISHWTNQKSEWGLKKDFFQPNLVKLFISWILEEDPSVNTEAKVKLIGDLNEFLSSDQLLSVWNYFANKNLYQDSYSEAKSIFLLEGIYRGYYDGIAVQLNNLANRFQLQEDQIKSIRSKLFSRESQAGIYIITELIRGAIVVNLRNPGAHLELIEWLLGKGDTAPSMAVDIVNSARVFSSYSNDLNATRPNISNQLSYEDRNLMQQISSQFTLERFREFYRDSPALGRALIISEMISSNQPNGMMASEKGRALVEQYLLRSFRPEHRPLASTMLNAYLNALGEEAHLFITQVLASQDPRGGEEINNIPPEAIQIKRIGEAKGALWIKILQILYGDRGLIADDNFREAFRSVLDRAAEPLREEIFPMLKKELRSEYEKIEHVGAIVGSGSINVNAVITLKDGSTHVAKLIKGNPENQAAHDLITVKKMIENLRSEAKGSDSVFSKNILKIANGLEEYVIAIGDKMKAEVDFRIERRLSDQLVSSYTRFFPETNVEINFLRESDSSIQYDKDHANDERVILYPYLKDQKEELTPEEKLRLKQAIFTTELEAIFIHKKYDPDGHWGNWLNQWSASKKTGKLILTRIDFSQGEIIEESKVEAFKTLLSYSLFQKNKLIWLLPGTRSVSAKEAALAYIEITDSDLSADQILKAFEKSVPNLLANSDSLNPVTIVTEIHGAMKENFGNKIKLSPKIRMVVKSLGTLQGLIDTKQPAELAFATEVFLKAALGWSKYPSKIASNLMRAKQWLVPAQEQKAQLNFIPDSIYNEILKDTTANTINKNSFEYLKEIYKKFPENEETILNLLKNYLIQRSQVFPKVSHEELRIERFQKEVFLFVLKNSKDPNLFLKESLTSTDGLSWMTVNFIISSEDDQLERLLVPAIVENPIIAHYIASYPDLSLRFLNAFRDQFSLFKYKWSFEQIAPLGEVLGKSFRPLAIQALENAESTVTLQLYLNDSSYKDPIAKKWWCEELDQIFSERLFHILSNEIKHESENEINLSYLYSLIVNKSYSKIFKPISILDLYLLYQNKSKPNPKADLQRRSPQHMIELAAEKLQDGKLTITSEELYHLALHESRNEIANAAFLLWTSLHNTNDLSAFKVFEENAISEKVRINAAKPAQGLFLETQTSQIIDINETTSLVKTKESFSLVEDGKYVLSLTADDKLASHLYTTASQMSRKKEKSSEYDALLSLFKMLETRKGRLDVILSKDFPEHDQLDFIRDMDLGFQMTIEEVKNLSRKIDKLKLSRMARNQLHIMLNHQVSESERGSPLEKELIELTHLIRNRGEINNNIHTIRGKKNQNTTDENEFWSGLKDWVSIKSASDLDFSKADFFIKHPLNLQDIENLSLHHHFKVIQVIDHLQFSSKEAFQLFYKILQKELESDERTYNNKFIDNEPQFERDLIQKKLQDLKKRMDCENTLTMDSN